uniref:Uncharacterized protein n=1 Tax=Desertifilum tharense IPPAS B-1220 TaxID=1781255 RepID=A0ACD5GRF9_9CYAN
MSILPVSKDCLHPYSGESGSVSGLELVGANITVEFDNGTSLSGKTYRIPNSLDGSQVTLKAGLPGKPTLEVLGLSSEPTTVSNANQTARISGTPGSQVSLLMVEAAAFSSSSGGLALQAYETNSAIAVNEKFATIGSTGYIDIPITLTKSNASGDTITSLPPLKTLTEPQGHFHPFKSSN